MLAVHGPQPQKFRSARLRRAANPVKICQKSRPRRVRLSQLRCAIGELHVCAAVARRLRLWRVLLGSVRSGAWQGSRVDGMLLVRHIGIHVVACPD